MHAIINSDMFGTLQEHIFGTTVESLYRKHLSIQLQACSD